MDKKVIGIKNKDSGFIASLQVCEDVCSYINEMRAAVKDRPCAYNMFPSKYQFVVFGIGEEESSVEFEDGHKN